MIGDAIAVDVALASAAPSSSCRSLKPKSSENVISQPVANPMWSGKSKRDTIGVKRHTGQ